MSGAGDYADGLARLPLDLIEYRIPMGVYGLELQGALRQEEGQVDAVADSLPVDPDDARPDLEVELVRNAASFDLCNTYQERDL